MGLCGAPQTSLIVQCPSSTPDLRLESVLFLCRCCPGNQATPTVANALHLASFHRRSCRFLRSEWKHHEGHGCVTGSTLPHRWPLPLLDPLSGRHASSPGPGAGRPGVTDSRGGGGEPSDPSATQPVAGCHRPSSRWQLRQPAVGGLSGHGPRGWR